MPPTGISKTGRNPAQKKTVVSRAAKAGKAGTLSKGPKPAGRDLAENRAQNRGAGPTKVGGATPAPTRGPKSSPRQNSGQPVIRNTAGSGGTLASRVNTSGKRRKAAG